MKLLIVRHGESEENSLGILQGLLPGKLNDQGKEQADKLGKRLMHEKIDMIYCSPIFRCMETLAIIQKYIDLSIPVIVTEMISERDFGQMSGKSWKEIGFDDLDQDSEKNRELGIESLEHVSRRARSFLNEIRKQDFNKTVLVISHSNTIRMIFTHLLKMSFKEVLEKIKIQNASLSMFDVDKNATPLVIGETDFLE